MIKFKILFVFSFFMFSSDFAFSQNSKKLAKELLRVGENNYRKKTSYADSLALKKTFEAINFLEQENPSNDLYEAYLLISRIKYGRFKDYKGAIYYKHKILNISNSINLPDIEFLELYKLFGQSFWNLKEYDSAFYYYEKGETLAESFSESRISADLYGYIGILYYDLGNFKQALNYTLKYLHIYEQSFPENKNAIIRAKNNIAQINNKLNRFDVCLKIYREIIPELEKLGDEKSRYNTDVHLYENLGTVLNIVGQYEDAKAKLYIAKERLKLNNENKDIELSISRHLGKSYMGLGYYDKALENFNFSIKKNIEYYGSENMSLAKIYQNKAFLYEKISQKNNSLYHIQKALNTLILNFNDSSFLSNPNYPFQTLSDLETFNALISKAEIIEKFNESNDPENSQLVLETYRLALQLAEKIRKSYDSDEAKLFFQNNVYPVFEQSIRVSLELFELTREEKYKQLAFQFSEQSKAAVLEESIKNHQIKGYTGIPKELLVQERDLKIQLSKVKSRLANANDQEKIDKYTLQLADLEIELGKVVKSFEAYPNYYALKYANNEVNLDDFQRKLLEEDKAMLEYFWGEKEIIGFLVTGENFTIKRFPLDSGLINQIEEYYSAYKSYSPGQSFDGHQAGYEIYKHIFEPFENELSAHEKLVIIPDGKLNYLPFDALRTDSNEKNYLIEEYIISQSYSGKLWLDAQKINNSGNNEILAMAPFAKDVALGYVAFRDKYFSPLPATRQEVKGISKNFYINEEATKNRFLDEYRNYNILHFATHAEVNEEEPSSSYITFYPKGEDNEYRLYVHEMYNLNFDSTKLVVLSGCETGSGQFQKGEGIMSLARAIAYAGCPNIIMTLWRAEDKSTSFIAQKMYKYLENGRPKDEALRQAKLDYLHSDEFFKIDKTPVHWANFIVIGNADPIANRPLYKQKYLWIALGLSLSMIFLFIRIKKRRINTKLL